jgi:hypothetical protein
MIDFENRRAIVVEGFDAVITYTTVQDLAAVVARAVEYVGEWPLNGGISGNRVAISQLLKIGQKVRGKSTGLDLSDGDGFLPHSDRSAVFN